jgi:hypothetical protein
LVLGVIVATWFAFNGYGTIELAGVQEKQAVGLGFHGYATKAEAEAHPNSVNLLQKAFVNLAEADYAAATKTQSQPGGKNSDLSKPSSILGIATSGVNANITVWFLRIGEVVLGIVLIAVGVAKLTGVSNSISTIAKVAAK